MTHRPLRHPARRAALGVLAGAALGLVPGVAQASVVAESARGPAILRGSYGTLTGGTLDLSKYRGRVVLLVNTASHCGYTAQYGALQQMWRENRKRGLVVIGVPSRDFEQEFASGAAVARFCKRNFGVTFPMLRISHVKGPQAIRIFRDVARPAWSQPPGWNFTKYYLDRKGRVAMRLDPGITPDSLTGRATLDRLLRERA